MDSKHAGAVQRGSHLAGVHVVTLSVFWCCGVSEAGRSRLLAREVWPTLGGTLAHVGFVILFSMLSAKNTYLKIYPAALGCTMRWLAFAAAFGPGMPRRRPLGAICIILIV